MAYPFALTLQFDHQPTGDIFVGSPGTGFQRAQAASSNTLAVEYLLPLSAQKNNSQVVLTWIASYDPHSIYFQIQRSIDLETWKDIGTKVVIRSSQQVQHKYKYVDESPVDGTSYYRLVETEMDGTLHYSRSVSINWSRNNSLHLFPNPVESILHWKASEGWRHVQIYNGVRPNW